VVFLPYGLAGAIDLFQERFGKAKGANHVR
jgi:hypothetical protein